MKLLSIDVGIKNLSFCLFDIDKSNKNKTIVSWDNINLTEKETALCCFIENQTSLKNKKKTKNTDTVNNNVSCDKPAKFRNGSSCYCLKHAKKVDNVMIMPTELKSSVLNKKKVADVIAICKKYFIQVSESNNNKVLKKQDYLDAIANFVSNKCFQPIEGVANASKVDLVTIGKNIQHRFDNLFKEPLDKIIIENQIGPLANKMKTIQGMLSQYFIMKNNNIDIEFISATNKLKGLVTNNDATTNDTTTNNKKKDIGDKKEYKKRKNLGVETCLQLINNEESFTPWKNFVEKHSKKDDLSDCFLQGIWYINNKL
jgi:hypothetical protein